MADDQLFYVGQKALIDKNGEVLVLNDPLFGLDLPGGKIQVGELDFEEALTREVMEETGLTISIEKPFTTGYFEFPRDTKHRNVGKKIFVVFYKAKYISGDVTLSTEHNKYQWVNKDTYKSLKATERTKLNITALEKYFEKK